MGSERIPGRNELHSEKVFVSNEGNATIGCSKCGITKHVSVAPYRGKKHTIKANCSCGETFIVYLEFRRSYRKKTDLKGTYRLLAGGGGPANINNISRDGVGFSVSGMHNIQIGQKAVLDFTLDNRKQTRLQKEVVIKSVRANHIGCAFSEQQAFEKDLGFYLQP